MKYRAEIDGLRAIAVLPVILFHAGFELFSGGFVGVDVFFVISGYLITTILIGDIERDKFSIIEFYERRARRILPALFFVMVACLPFAWMWMLPEQMQEFSKSLIAVSVFVSNVLFYTESGYFETDAEEKPLLHTWSLAVEEQYYVLFPVFLFLTWRFGRNVVFWLIVAIALISLLVSEWGWRNFPDANFYLAHARAWELLAGSLAAFIVHQRGVQRNDFLALLGLAGIAISIFFYDQTTPAPSLYMLVPVLGVVLIVLFADSDSLTGKMLGNKLFVGIGLISYSAYLWHQPLFAFARIRLLEHPSDLLMLGLSVCALLLAYLSWRFVEKPFRNKSFLTTKQVFTFSLAGALVFISAGILGVQSEGFKDRFGEDDVRAWVRGTPELRHQTTFVRGEDAFDHLKQKRFSKLSNAQITTPENFTGDRKILILGDSHAGHLRSGFVDVVADHFDAEVHILSSTGCPPLFGHYKVFGIYQKAEIPRQRACRRQTEVWRKFVRDHGSEYEFVILSSRWNWLVNKGRYETTKIREDAAVRLDTDPQETRKYGIERRISNLSTAFQETAELFVKQNVPLFILSQPPVQLLDIRKLRLPAEFDTARPARSAAMARHENFEKAITQSGVTESDRVFYFDFTGLYCSTEKARCENRERRKSFYKDKNHLSAYGSEQLGLAFVKEVSELDID